MLAADVHRSVLPARRIEGHNTVDDTVRDVVFQHISDVVPSCRWELVGGPHLVTDRLSQCCPIGGNLVLCHRTATGFREYICTVIQSGVGQHDP